MDINLLLKGFLMGFSIAMPVGPIGMLCIRNSLLFGMTCGLVTGLGAALGDSFYGALTIFGSSSFSHFIDENLYWIQLVGVLFLCYLGITTFFSKPLKLEDGSEVVPTSYWKIFLTTFILTITNPLTLFCFACIYGMLGIESSENLLLRSLILTLGIFLGSTFWWLILSSASSIFKNKVTPYSSGLLNKISGIIILAFAFIAAASIFAF